VPGVLGRVAVCLGEGVRGEQGVAGVSGRFAGAGGRNARAPPWPARSPGGAAELYAPAFPRTD